MKVDRFGADCDPMSRKADLGVEMANFFPTSVAEETERHGWIRSNSPCNGVDIICEGPPNEVSGNRGANDERPNNRSVNTTVGDLGID